MADVMTHGFEVIVSNSKRNDTQNITGIFGTVAGSPAVHTAAAVYAGTLCKKADAMVEGKNRPFNEGYAAAGIRNKNDFYMIAADDGLVAKFTGDHTGIYAANTYNVNQLSDGTLSINFPGKTLGLQTPAGEKTDFTEIIVGEMYAFGYLNTSYAATPDSSASDSNFAPGTILYVANGVLSSVTGDAGELAFEVIDGTGRFTEGAADGGRKIIVQAIRVPAST